MWRWCLNSKTSCHTAGDRRFKEVWDGIGRSSHNLIYTCTRRKVRKWWYITWKGVQREDEKKKTEKKESLRNKTPEGKIRYTWLYHSGQAEGEFYILFVNLFFQIIHNCYLFSKFRLVLSHTLYKFIVWACWTWIQSCFGSPNRNWSLQLQTTILKFRGA